MIALVKRNPLISALGVLAVALLVVLALELASGASLRERIAGTTTRPAAPVQTRLLPALAAVNPDQEYPEFAARPLFTPTRRPAPPQVVAGAQSAMVKGQFILTGVIIANGLKTALLREKSSGRVMRVEKGREVNGVTVAEIEPDNVTLAQGGDHEVVGLVVQKSGAVHSQPAPPARPPAAISGPFAPPPLAATPTAPAVTPAAVPDPTVNPAARAAPPPPTSGFGPPPFRTPTPQSQSAADPAAATTALTPEELLARRRARRAQ